ncbi:hypothetical protein I79_010276 [Cricetulus griseus]|uniref:Uncharacterized protein n=1 Tax=Cricetulus griseus TaxID=10029 RepID=G3HI12_CRIGR|nr:hypothetical protein I79_010276 [Cricetulus griseus]
MESHTMLSSAENVNYLILVVCVVSSRCCCFLKSLKHSVAFLLFSKVPTTQFRNHSCTGSRHFFMLEKSINVASALDLLLLFYYSYLKPKV